MTEWIGINGPIGINMHIVVERFDPYRDKKGYRVGTILIDSMKYTFKVQLRLNHVASAKDYRVVLETPEGVRILNKHVKSWKEIRAEILHQCLDLSSAMSSIIARTHPM